MVADCIVTNWWATGDDGAPPKKGGIVLSEPVLHAADTLRDFMFPRVYTGPEVTPERQRAERVVTALWRYYEANPDGARRPSPSMAEREGLSVALKDYIAGMTDCTRCLFR